jgi:hypothetical protein
MGPSVWLPGFTPQHLKDNGQGVDVIDGLMTPIDRAADRQLDRVHRTAFDSERSDVVAFVEEATANNRFVSPTFAEFFKPRLREADAPEGKYIEDPDVASQIDAYRDAGLLRQPAGMALGIEFIPEGSDQGPAGAHVRLSTAVTKGCVGTLEVTQVASLNRRQEQVPDELMRDKMGLYDRLVDAPQVPIEVFPSIA